MAEAKAFVLIKVGTGENLNFLKSVKEDICKVKGVEEVEGIFGRYDFIAKAGAKNLIDLSNLVDCVRSVKGVTNTETLVMGF